MGNFHIIGNFMSRIEEMFGDAGPRDLAKEAGVIVKVPSTRSWKADSTIMLFISTC